jgi:dolichol kinase
MGTGIAGLALYHALGSPQRMMATALLSVALIAFVIEFLRLRSLRINRLVVAIMGPFMRECERTRLSGFPFYALGVSLALFLFPERIAILAITFLVFADPISSLFGILYGKTKILPNKSLEGALAGFATCYTLALAYVLTDTDPGLAVAFFALGAGFVGAVSELFSVWIDDNLSIPLISGAGLTLLNALFQVL